LPEGEPRKKANALMPEISAKWASMTEEEKKASTEDKLKELQETCEMHKLEKYNHLHVLMTGECMEDFFNLAFKKNVWDLGVQMEAYMLSGVQALTTFKSTGTVATDTVAMASSTSTPDTTSSTIPVSTFTTPTIPAPLTINFVNSGTVSGLNSEVLVVTKKLRKTHKDKGVPQKKRQVAENDENHDVDMVAAASE
ncbi:hypothetical protein C0995_011108, partial [Termitomyces sp. Mi166